MTANSNAITPVSSPFLPSDRVVWFSSAALHLALLVIAQAVRFCRTGRAQGLDLEKETRALVAVVVVVGFPRFQLHRLFRLLVTNTEPIMI